MSEQAVAMVFFGHILAFEQWQEITDDPRTECVVGNCRYGVAVASTSFKVEEDRPEKLPFQYVNKEKLAAFKEAIRERLPHLIKVDPDWHLMCWRG